MLPKGETETPADFYDIGHIHRFERLFHLITPDNVPAEEGRDWLTRPDLKPTTRNDDGSWNTKSGYRWVPVTDMGTTEVSDAS